MDLQCRNLRVAKHPVARIRLRSSTRTSLEELWDQPFVEGTVPHSTSVHSIHEAAGCLISVQERLQVAVSHTEAKGIVLIEVGKWDQDPLEHILQVDHRIMMTWIVFVWLKIKRIQLA